VINIPDPQHWVFPQFAISLFFIYERRNYSVFVLTLLGKRLLSLVLAYVPFLFGFAIAFSILLKVNLFHGRRVTE
jgi:hypothetical protein